MQNNFLCKFLTILTLQTLLKACMYLSLSRITLIVILFNGVAVVTIPFAFNGRGFCSLDALAWNSAPSVTQRGKRLHP